MASTQSMENGPFGYTFEDWNVQHENIKPYDVSAVRNPINANLEQALAAMDNLVVAGFMQQTVDEAKQKLEEYITWHKDVFGPLIHEGADGDRRYGRYAEYSIKDMRKILDQYIEDGVELPPREKEEALRMF